MTEPTAPQPKIGNRFSGNEIAYYASAAALFAGVWLMCSLGAALVVIGALGVLISLANTYLLILLPMRRKEK
jgi:hypothetical protein